MPHSPLLRRLGIAFLSCWILAIVSESPVIADITLSKLFSDHMVLQRNSEIEIWGTAASNQSLSIAFAGQQVSTQANPDGRWTATLSTADAGGPHQMEIFAQGGEPKIILSNVMVGEVWLCSGQSNMGWMPLGVLNAKTEIDRAKSFPNVRLFTVDHHSSLQPLKRFSKVKSWQVCSPKSVSDFSAIAYFFGRELSKDLGSIPIGLIHTSWGGTAIESWISRSAMDETDELSPLLRHWDARDAPSTEYRPGNLYNAMIAPLARFKIRGTIWYQGEANIGRGEQYACLLPTLIENWRQQFGNPKMPFYFVQIAPYRYSGFPPEALPELWEAQLKTLKTVPHVGMVVTTDVGEIDNVHPKNKQPVGRRLARLALAHDYRDDLPSQYPLIVSSGPIFRSQAIEGNSIWLTFDHIGEGLRKRVADQPLSHMTICGQDGIFVPATAKIVGDKIEVHSPNIENPKWVRFGWHDTAQPNLINSAGLPASPFRTDDFPLESAGRSF